MQHGAEAQRMLHNLLEALIRLGWRHDARAGLPSHPTHAAARRILKGFGMIISFDLRGGADCNIRQFHTGHYSQ